MRSKHLLLISLMFIFLSALLWHFFWNYYTPGALSDFGQFYSETIGIILAIGAAVAASVIAYKTYNQQVKV